MSRRFLNITILIMFIASTTPANIVHAQTDWDSIPGITSCHIDNVATIRGFGCILANLISVAIQSAGIVAFIMLIIGGFKFLTGGSDPQKIEAAKKTLTLSIAGLIMAVIAWLILQFIEVVTGVKVTEFNIPQ